MPARLLVRVAANVLAIALTVSSGDADAEGARKVINAMAVTVFPPFEFADASGNLVGFDIDILNGMASKMGTQVNWTQSTFAQIISFAPIKTARADILSSALGDTPERRASVNFIDYVYQPYVFYTLRANAENFTNIETLCGKRVGAIRTSVIETGAVVKWSEENCTKAGKPAIIVVPGENTPQVRLMVKQGFADAGLTGAAIIAYQNTLEGNQYVVVGNPVIKLLTGMAFSKDDLQFAQELKQALGALIADGTYGQLLQKWGLPEDASIQKPMVNGEP
ncbi:ABC transporter substrate-binding protein [Bradyrhizobium sp. CW1]|uniref:ABC transporter substrate-binding protein n=1 Tax=Bradyrhizobium sp. CW1 TaxID=2782686 RepID=UPI001FFFD86A|nr:ABC transporter substrate-binding protein [Bradyrhizobium sp. CW1]UPJ26391.1 ABC transporter substrate-binding protein [Bradyrhizobium sp. CW1]